MGAVAHGPIMPDVNLLADENPWGLSPIDLTIYAVVRAQGLSMGDAARKYFAPLPGWYRRNLIYVQALMGSSILVTVRKNQPDSRNERLAALWKATINWRVTIAQQTPEQQEYWQKLLSQPPLILAPPLTEEEETLLATATVPAKKKVLTKIRSSVVNSTEDPDSDITIPEPKRIVWPKICERCRGPIRRLKDKHGEFARCLIGCGYEFNPPSSTQLDLPVEIEGSSIPVFIEPPLGRRPPSHGKMRL